MLGMNSTRVEKELSGVIRKLQNGVFIESND